MFICKQEIVVGRVGPCPVCFIIMRQCCLCNIIIDNIRMIRIRHWINERRIMVDTKVRSKWQSFNRFQFNISITKQTPIIQMIITVIVRFAQWILTVAHTTDRTCKCCPVFLIYRNSRCHFQSILHRSTVHLTRISHSEILTNSQILIYIVWRVHAGWYILKIRIFQNTIILFISKRKHGRMLFIGMWERQVIILRESCTGNFIQPVGIGIFHCLFLVDIAVIQAIDRIIHITPGCRIPHRDRSTRCSIQIQPIVTGISNRI